MREIIHIQVGQCGNQIGTKFWEVINSEHNIDGNGVLIRDKDMPNSKVLGQEYLGVYYNELTDGHFVPRAILADLEPGTLDTIRGGHLGGIFNPDNMIFGNNGAGNNFAKGFFTEGAEFIDRIMDATRKEVERSDCLQGFQLTHSLGGGTGSGLGSLILSKLSEDFSDRITSTYTVFPSPKVSDVIVESYNAMLSMHQLITFSDMTCVLDNEATFGIYRNILKVYQPSYSDLNSLISKVVSGITASLRFPGLLNADLRKLAVNMIPFPRIHFFSAGYVPLAAAREIQYSQITAQEICRQAFDGRAILAACDPKLGRYLTSSLIFRGSVSSKEVDDSIKQSLDRNSGNFVEWIPNSIKTVICRAASSNDINDLSGIFINNSTSIRTIFSRIHSQFKAMYSKKKAFVHLYLGEGMDLSEFTDAESNICDLMDEYQQYENYDANEDEY